MIEEENSDLSAEHHRNFLVFRYLKFKDITCAWVTVAEIVAKVEL